MTSDSTPPVSGASLNDQLAGLLVDSRFPEATVCQFLPHGSIEQLIGRASIIDELFLDESRGDNRSQVPAGSQDDALVDFILHSAKKIFTICLMSHLKLEELRTAMERFSKHSFTDEKLPVDFESKPPPFSIDKLWTASRINEFKVKQWRVLAPVFPKEFVRLELSERHVLPFTNVDSERKEGTFGAVYQVTIHQAHQERPMQRVDGTRSNVAIKELKAYAGGQGENAHQIYEEWQAEAKALEETSRLDHSHIVPVKAIITKGQRNYFMFQWADGGSLRDLFQRKPKPVLTRGLVEDIAVQLTGIADALSALHNFQNNGAYRHGDLKPENILIFGNGKRIGLWTIADMGLAKCHYVSTGLRGPTSTRYATPSYEPPEVRTDPTAARSRLYDIWSMGCIVLELIIWLLYDCDDLDRFNRSLSGDDGSRGPYWVYHRRMNIAEVSPKVKKIIKYIRDDLSGTSSAMEDLLRIVENDLLVVALPALSRRQTGIGRSLADLQSPRGSNVLQQGRGNPSVVVSYAEDRDKSASSQTAAGPHRASANELCKALKDILKKGKGNPTYWFAHTSHSGHPTSYPGPPQPNHLAAPSQHGQPSPNLLQSQTPSEERKNMTYTHEPLDNVWDYPIDNDFAQKVLADPQLWPGTSQLNRQYATLCDECEKLDLRTKVDFRDDLDTLANRSDTCDFCRLRWQVSKDVDRSYGPEVYFDKQESNLRLNEGHPPALTIHTSPESCVSDSGLRWQIGLPQLPPVGSRAYFTILDNWLTDCDLQHPECKVPSTTALPTRLIFVGCKRNPALKLYETQPHDRMRYFALSHPWGRAPHFCTFPCNIESHKRSISFASLPLTFQNAITVTRGLGLEYLWIDSICIIQGPDGDFRHEAARMEDVFSNAYCVLAASSALGQSDGFLKSRDERLSVMLQQIGKPPLFVCEFMDNFRSDVLESHLSRRGWVLQERALARRTIYFTKTQTYWECGDGVRCETMSRTNNTLASFLGDPQFPNVGIESSRGGKILLHQNLCMQYSRLEFTRQRDRPIAISGLEKRLVHSFGICGGFGVLDDGENPGLFRRSMLWHRASDCTTLKRIQFDSSAPPTWSWMSYEGHIEYLDLPFARVHWEQLAIVSPWLGDKTPIWYSLGDHSGLMEVPVVVRSLSIIDPQATENGPIILDIVDDTALLISAMCVVLGITRDSTQEGPEGRTHAILVLTASVEKTASSLPVYNRIGVGFVPGHWIGSDDEGKYGVLV